MNTFLQKYFMKNIIIYTTNDEIVSLKLVERLLSEDDFKSYKFDIIISNSSLIRKIKVLLVFLIFGSITDFYKEFKKRVSIKEILAKHKNCKIVKKIEKNYDYGLNIYGLEKIDLEKFKIYNFHLGSLKNQRGSFIFFYKYIFNWEQIDLTFHEVNQKYDVGKIYNKRTICLDKKVSSTKICFLYLYNLDFLGESIKKIESENFTENKDYDKINLVPSFLKIFKLSIMYFFGKIN